MARLNFDQITAFLTVVRLGGVRRAAQALHVTQPAITTRLKNLEAALSKPLFHRTASGLKLTKEGELFLPYAERFQRLSDMVEEKVIDPDKVEGHLRIGASETVTQCWLPDFVARVHAHFPLVQIEINVDISSNLRDALLDREIDLALLLGPVSEFSVDNIELPDFDLAWYAAADMPPPGEGEASYLEKAVISYARHTRPYRELKAALLERVGPQVSVFPSSSLSACFRLVEAGLGVAALPRALGAPVVAAGRLREFDPGWAPKPLKFTASYLGEPKSHMVETAAKTALAAAQAFDHINFSNQESKI